MSRYYIGIVRTAKPTKHSADIQQGWIQRYCQAENLELADVQQVISQVPRSPKELGICENAVVVVPYYKTIAWDMNEWLEIEKRNKVICLEDCPPDYAFECVQYHRQNASELMTNITAERFEGMSGEERQEEIEAIEERQTSFIVEQIRPKIEDFLVIHEGYTSDDESKKAAKRPKHTPKRPKHTPKRGKRNQKRGNK